MSRFGSVNILIKKDTLTCLFGLIAIRLDCQGKWKYPDKFEVLHLYPESVKARSWMLSKHKSRPNLEISDDVIFDLNDFRVF